MKKLLQRFIALIVVIISILSLTSCAKEKTYYSFLSYKNKYIPISSEVEEYSFPNCILKDSGVYVSVENMNFEIGYVKGNKITQDDEVSGNEILSGKEYKIFKEAKEDIVSFFKLLNMDVSDDMQKLKLANISDLDNDANDQLLPASYMGGRYIFVSSISETKKNNFDFKNLLIHEMIHYILNKNQETWFVKDGVIINFWANEGISSLIANYISDTSFKTTDELIFGYNRQMSIIAILIDIYGINVFKDMFQGNDFVYQDMESVMGKTNFVAFYTAFDQVTLSDDVAKSEYLLNFVINPIFQKFVNDKGYNYNIISMRDFK